jgi:UDP-glucose 4-epimerase
LKNYLITGGAGFIGSHLIEKIIDSNNHAIIIDDLSTGFKDYIPLNSSVKFIKSRIQDIDLSDIGENLDGIFHLAAQASVPISIEDFFTSSSNNLLSSLRIFEIANLYETPVVFASSSAIYGNLKIGDDQKDIVDILSPYAQDKLTLENYAKMCFSTYGVSSLGLRFFNVYGPRQDPTNPYSGVISIFIDRLLKNKRVVVNGGYQTRDFIYVNDIANILINSMKYLHNHKTCNVLNVGTGKSISINNLLSLLADITQVTPKMIIKKLPKGDPERSDGLYTKLNKILKINTDKLISIEQGLINTVEYLKNTSSL